MNRGEVRWYKFRPPDKRRPVLILTRDSIIGYMGEITVAPVSTTVREIPTEVALSSEDGMPRDCAVNLDHIQTVQKKQIGGLLTTLSTQKLCDVSAAIQFALDL